MTTISRIYVALGAAIFVAFFGCALAWAGDGGQEQERVDVAVFELKGDGIEGNLLKTLSGVLRREAQQHSRYALANPAAIQRDEIALVVGCDPQLTECLRQMGEYVDGQVLIFGEVSDQSGALVVTIDILDIDSDEEPVRVQRRIEDVSDPVVAFRREVEEIFDELESMGETHLVVEAPHEDMPIRLGTVTIGHGSVERRGMRPGSYRVVVGDRDAPVWDDEVHLVVGQLVEIRPELVEEEPAEQEEEEIAADPPEMEVEESTFVPGETRRAGPVEYEDRRSNMGAYSLMGVGAMALMGSGVMALAMRRVEDRIVSEADQGILDEARHEQLIGRGETYETAQYVLLGVGIAAVSGGAGWTFFNSRSEGSERDEMGMSWTVEPTTRGVSISGWW